MDKDLEINNQEIIIVSGLPRSGTSMMMKILDAGGIPPLTDGLRQPDPHNPRGYYEYERVKKLPEGDVAWLGETQGKAVKIISALIKYIPDSYNYRVIFMERSMTEILKSQKQMLQDRGKMTDQVADEALAVLFEQHNRDALIWMSQKKNIQCHLVNYNEILTDPESSIKELTKFLERDLDIPSMVNVVDRDLYRQRKSP